MNVVYKYIHIYQFYFLLLEILAKMEEEKNNLVIEIETLKNEVNKKNLMNEKTEENMKIKLQHLKVCEHILIKVYLIFNLKYFVCLSERHF